MLTQADLFERWLNEAQPGNRHVYYRGPSLAEARSQDPVIELIADKADHLGTAKKRVVMSECYHPRHHYVPEQKLQLSQVKDGPGSFVYIAERL